MDNAILPAWAANHSVGYGSSCPFMELAIHVNNKFGVYL